VLLSTSAVGGGGGLRGRARNTGHEVEGGSRGEAAADPRGMRISVRTSADFRSQVIRMSRVAGTKMRGKGCVVTRVLARLYPLTGLRRRGQLGVLAWNATEDGWLCLAVAGYVTLMGLVHRTTCPSERNKTPGRLRRARQAFAAVARRGAILFFVWGVLRRPFSTIEAG